MEYEKLNGIVHSLERMKTYFLNEASIVVLRPARAPIIITAMAVNSRINNENTQWPVTSCKIPKNSGPIHAKR